MRRGASGGEQFCGVKAAVEGLQAGRLLLHLLRVEGKPPLFCEMAHIPVFCCALAVMISDGQRCTE